MRLGDVLVALQQAGLPFKIFEAYRTPQRQQYLYAQGRSTPGPKVTNAPPWSSYHQYGLAADFVLFDDGQWSWKSSGKWKSAWVDMNNIGKQHGLEPLSWELPHLQLANLKIADIRAGTYPDGGDDTWLENLEAQITGWNGSPSAPPIPAGVAVRPPLPEQAQENAEETGVSPLASNNRKPVGSAGWHDQFGGRQWRFDGNGVYLKDVNGGAAAVRTPGEPTTCRAIWKEYGPIISVMAAKYDLAPEIVIMTIACEAAAYKDQKFTGPDTFRWEAHVWNEDVSPRSQGDYSAGPMQTLASTARWVIQAQNLPYHRFQVAPVYALKPSPIPASHPLYDGATNIEIGCAEIRQRIGATGGDPILVAAAFNAGGIYKSTENLWHMRSYGNHLDRAAQWFGDACAVLKEVA